MIFILGALALLASAGTAHAAFLIAPIVAAVGLTGIAATITTSLIVAAISLGVSYLLRPKQPKEQEGGIELDVSFDPLHPQTLIVGRAVVAGSMVYRESYGNTNQNLIEIFDLADHPCEGLVTQFVEGQEVDLTDTGGIRGFTVDGYLSKLAIRFFDGSQTTTDAYTLAALSGHADRPWTSNHIGRTRTYARAHYVYDREKVPGPLPWKFVVDGIRLYDLRKDTTAGGSGTHRWDDLSTHEFTRNLPCIAYNILRGIRVTDAAAELVHFYGLEGTPAANLPFDNWVAAMNEADVQVDLDGSTGTESQFHGGLEIPVNMEPIEALKEILKATGGRLTEVGGVYKLYLGAPGLPVATFDDGVVPANRSDLFEPIRPQEQQTTYITGNYVSPDDGWIEKAPPARTDTDRETALGWRIEADLSAPMIQSGPHMQRVMQQILNRVGREKRHSLPLPPALFGVEPGDVLEWNSTRNGYVDKLFEVEGAEIDASLITIVHLLEVDAADYDWDEADELPQAIGSLTQTRPAPKIIDGFSATGFLHEGDTGTKRPAISLTWTPPDDDDITGIALQIRRASEPTEIVTLPSIDDREGVEAGEVIILSGLAPETAYEVRARFKSFGGWATDWSLWIPVTTPAAGVTAEELDATLTAAIDYVVSQLPIDKFLIQKQLDELGSAFQGAVSAILERAGQINLGVGAVAGEARASADLALIASAQANSAIAAFLVGLFAENGEGEAEGLIRFIAAATPGDAVASFAIEVRASFDVNFAEAGFYIDVGAFANGAASRIRLVSDQLSLENPATGLILDAFLFVQSDAAAVVPIVAGEITADLTSRRMQHKTILTAAAEMQLPTGAKPGFFYKHLIQQDATGGWALTFDSVHTFGTPPTLSTIAETLASLEITILDTTPLKMLVTLDGEALEDPSFTFIGHTAFDVRTFTPIGGAAGGVAGELMVVAAYAYRTSGGVPPTISVPAAWTLIDAEADATSAIQSMAMVLAYKRLDGSETSPIGFIGTSGTSYSTQAVRFSGGFVLSEDGTLEGGQIDQLSFSAQTIDLSPGVAAPVIAFGFFGCRDGSLLGSRVFTPTQDAQLTNDVGSFDHTVLYYKIYNSAPADISIDWNFGSATGAGLVGGYVKG